MANICTQNWTQDLQQEWHHFDHDIQLKQLISSSEISTNHSHKDYYNDIHQNKFISLF
jgi:hypothetical protein